MFSKVSSVVTLGVRVEPGREDDGISGAHSLSCKPSKRDRSPLPVPYLQYLLPHLEMLEYAHII